MRKHVSCSINRFQKILMPNLSLEIPGRGFQITDTASVNSVGYEAGMSHDRLCRQHKYIHAGCLMRLKDEAGGGLKLGCGA
jgi:hypothetical protein